MGVRICMRLVAIPLLTILCLATFAIADQGRPGRLVTLDNKERSSSTASWNATLSRVGGMVQQLPYR